MWISLALLCIAFKSLSAQAVDPENLSCIHTLAHQVKYCREIIYKENCFGRDAAGNSLIGKPINWSKLLEDPTTYLSPIINPSLTLPEQLDACKNHIESHCRWTLDPHTLASQLDECNRDLIDSNNDHKQCSDQLQDLKHAIDDDQETSQHAFGAFINPFGTVAQQLDQCKRHIIDELCLGGDYNPFDPNADPAFYIEQNIINPSLTLAEQLDYCKKHIVAEGCLAISNPCLSWETDLKQCKTDLTESNNEHQQCRDQLQLTNQDLQHRLDDDVQFMTSIEKQLNELLAELNKCKADHAGGSTPSVSTPSTGTTTSNCAEKWARCGGKSASGPYTGPTCCKDGFVCNYQSEWYSQCVPPSQVSPNQPGAHTS